MPGVADDVTLIAAHDAHSPEAGLLIAPDGCRVRRRRVDGDAVVATLVDQVAHDAPERLAPQAAAVELWIEEQIDRRVPVSRLVLLTELDQPAIFPSTSIVSRVASGSSHGKPSAGRSHQRATSGVS